MLSVLLYFPCSLTDKLFNFKHVIFHPSLLFAEYFKELQFFGSQLVYIEQSLNIKRVELVNHVPLNCPIINLLH
jgi:hypothetical protein